MRTAVSTAIVFLLSATLGAVAVDRHRTAEACPPVHEPLPDADLAGAYDSNFGPVVLQQKGARVTGSYECCGGGTINGYMRGDTITFTWQQPGSRGRGVWRYDEGALRGTWGWDDSSSSGGAWNLERSRARVAVAE